ncbi:DUF2625 family protein [Amycolatopsis sp. WAC 04197]|uniref:DUF2625 family protein n=1 Tax=Amycolatopsis sp. WAC 04197 TaxID=2203199 RepID=UPI001F1C4F79|nr:DUF2625 family protein [Amycolatopsis sp. WAC 04197]
MTTSAWDEVSAAVEAAPYPVTVLVPDSERAARCLRELGITTGSWLGAVVGHTGGLLVDHGWLRVLGGGTGALPGILDDAEPASGTLPIAYDVLGGVYAWSVKPAGQPTVHYFGPDALAWEDLELGYAGWLNAMLSGSLDEFYETLRWPGWRDEVGAVPDDKGIHTFPPPWSKEGKDLSTVSRKVVPLAELVSFHQDAARQLNGQ